MALPVPAKFQVTIPPRDGVRFTGALAESGAGRPILDVDGETKIGEIVGAQVSEDGYLILDLTVEADAVSVAFDGWDARVGFAMKIRWPAERGT